MAGPGRPATVPGRTRGRLPANWAQRIALQQAQTQSEPIKIPKKRGPKPGSKVGVRNLPSDTDTTQPQKGFHGVTFRPLNASPINIPRVNSMCCTALTFFMQTFYSPKEEQNQTEGPFDQPLTSTSCILHLLFLSDSSSWKFVWNCSKAGLSFNMLLLSWVEMNGLVASLWLIFERHPACVLAKHVAAGPKTALQKDLCEYLAESSISPVIFVLSCFTALRL